MTLSRAQASHPVSTWLRCTHSRVRHGRKLKVTTRSGQCRTPGYRRRRWRRLLTIRWRTYVSPRFSADRTDRQPGYHHPCFHRLEKLGLTLSCECYTRSAMRLRRSSDLCPRPDMAVRRPSLQLPGQEHNSNTGINLRGRGRGWLHRGNLSTG